MIHFDLPKEKSSIIKVVGVGGGGSNAVNHMYSQHIEGVNFIICNTDAQAIAQSQVPNKIQLGPHLTQGLGAGANPTIGKQATEESLEEIKRIIEVNTKMAFITAGMGGGTGTGGAPIIAKICKELGVLTVGIVTTPFSYEGKKRQLQAEEGIQQLKQHVDTLLVISNDKLRHQFGNLKMKEAFSKADNVLATAAKCITDVINSTGQINVDFADVCTVMRNGGVAILGSAAAEGETRAQMAIEEALNSPLLNDNDIRGAKWILININSAEGEHEFTMDEVDIIQNYLLSRAGEYTDVILGLGYDNTLGAKIGITLIATGFEYKDPFAKDSQQQTGHGESDKIVVELNTQPAPVLASIPVQSITPEPVSIALPEDEQIDEDVELPAISRVVVPVSDLLNATAAPINFHVEEVVAPATISMQVHEHPVEGAGQTEPAAIAMPEVSVEAPALTDSKELFTLQFEDIPSTPVVVNATAVAPVAEQPVNVVADQSAKTVEAEQHSPMSAASGGYLAKPSNIYAEHRSALQTDPIPAAPVKEAAPEVRPSLSVQAGEEPPFDMQVVIREESSPAADPTPTNVPDQIVASLPPTEDLAMLDEVDEQKRRAAERIQKLRNLSFNVNNADPNNEFETVPAYVRRNLELYNTVSPAENFYSNYTVKADEQNPGQISALNTFLDGQKPD
jgi:cell division protein FtsZ